MLLKSQNVDSWFSWKIGKRKGKASVSLLLVIASLSMRDIILVLSFFCFFWKVVLEKFEFLLGKFWLTLYQAQCLSLFLSCFFKYFNIKKIVVCEVNQRNETLVTTYTQTGWPYTVSYPKAWKVGSKLIFYT